MTATRRAPADSRAGKPSGRTRGRSGLIAALTIVVLIGVVGTATLGIEHTGTRHPATATVASPATAGDEKDSTATGFGVPRIDVFGRRVDVPRNPFGQPLPQTIPPRESADKARPTVAPALPVQGGWQQVAGASVPFSSSDGPTEVVDTVAAGWAHTPQGAALAAVYAAYQVTARPGDRRVREHLIENPPGALAAFEASSAAGKIPNRLPENVSRYLVAPDAYRIDSCTDDMAVVEIATRTTDSTGTPVWLATQLVTVWDRGDWRLQPPPGGSPPQHTTSSLSGWTTW
ncbi:hypothetical protein [Nocardia sp. BMG111209]|uniref:hypothetical protein n=1 Tax=Nocardia sp. BMG111209 TaxID=1160137 RepID=UPI0007C5032E|nr:hypothetical protein [Nocardia sp. BMG111209]